MPLVLRRSEAFTAIPKPRAPTCFLVMSAALVFSMLVGWFLHSFLAIGLFMGCAYRTWRYYQHDLPHRNIW
ncbi:MAG: hypothetical protein GWO39_00530 [Gammaproteobacteria bacterium]|nr:hypothetical protein [Gammaproteobacteria bacterium]NIT62329.1 hypothetical protein [Gammaproteobacteria bacterium]NIV19252.1 hypothetical protein [Gammaproteobacteria bacterium]NIY30909.1 hypothetical protein [Gammaproteobacteria bacterium]